MNTKKLTFWVIVAIILPTSPAFADLTDGLVLYCTLDGNANDESGGGHDGTVYGAIPTSDRFGDPGSAFYFDGLKDYIDFGDIEIVTGNTMSVQAWFKTTGSLDYATALVSKLYASVAYHLGGSLWGGDKIQFEIGPAEIAESNSSLNDGYWHHAVGVYDGTLASDNVKLFIDGVLQATTHNHTQNIPDVPEPLTIGATKSRDGSTIADFFDGIIDDVRIYDRALSPAEVIELLNYEPPTPVVQIQSVITEKLALLEQLNDALDKEQEIIVSLDESLASGDYGGLTRGDITAARQKVNTAIQQQQQAQKSLQRSIDNLEDALLLLGVSF
jgi:hypothetical protein